MDCLKSENVKSAVKIVDLNIVLIKKYRGWHNDNKFCPIPNFISGHKLSLVHRYSIISKPAEMLYLAQTIEIIGTVAYTVIVIYIPAICLNRNHT